jgi:hypothetical protein
MIRKTLLTTLLFLLLVAVFLMNGWNLFNLNHWLQERLVGQLRSRLGKNCTIEKTTFGFGSVNLIGVDLELDHAPYHLWIDELRLGFSLESLWRGRARPEKSADEISIHGPRLTLIYGEGIEGEDSNIDLSLQLSEEAEESYRSFIKEYDFIERITITEGDLLARQFGDSVATTVATNINGWAYTDKTDHAWVRVAGHIFESEEFNLVMYGQLDLRRGGIDYLNAELHDYQVGNEIPFLLPDYLQVTDGVVNGKFTITERLQPTKGFNVEGDFRLDSGDLRLVSENLFFDDIFIEASLKNWNLVVKEATQKVNGSLTRLTGDIRNILSPELNLHLTSDAVAVHDFLERFLPEKQFPFEGTAKLDFRISDSIEHPRLQGVVSADSLLVYGKALKDLHVDVTYDAMNLRFADIAASFEEAGLQGSGNIEFGVPGKLLNFDINIDGEFTEALRDLGISSADKCIGTTRTRIFGPLTQPVSTSELNLEFLKKTETLALNGALRYSRGRIEITSQNNLNNFQLQVSIDSVFSNRAYVIDIRHLENVLDFLDQPRFDFIKNRYSVNLSGGGTEDSLRLEFAGFLKNDYQKVFQIQSLNNATKQQVAGTIHLLPNSEKATFGSFLFDRVAENEWQGSCQIGNWLKGGLTYASASQDSLGGILTISGLELPLFLELVGKKAEGYSGDIFGQIKLDSQQEEPNFDGHLWLMNAAFGRIAPLQGEFVFRADNREMTINKIFVANSESSFLNAAGKIHFDDRHIDMSVNGEGINLYDLLTTVTGRDSVVQGVASMDVRLNGRFGAIPLSGTVIVDRPHILMFDFDEAVFNFGQNGESNGSYISGDALNTENVTLKTDDFTVTGKAFLPFESTHDLDVSLSGDGNFLSLLEDLTDLFEDSESLGHLDFNMAGFYTTPHFAGSSVQFHEGVLNLSSVTKRVENLTGQLTVREDDYFLDIQRLRGTIGGREIRIANTNTLGGLNHGIYEPLRIAGNDLNLGALILHTDGGIPINVPGLMEEREIGWYEFSGKTSAEDFFIAGPWERPRVRGRVHVQNANLTFPFDESLGEGNPVVLNIMNNINWDVDAVASNDTRYVREFQTGVYVNMEVDKENSRLDFNGIMKDSSFAINGRVETTRGDIEYLDLNFRVEKIGAEWNNSLYPNVYGKAWTVVRDSTNIPTDVYLTLFTLDDLTKSEVSKGRWDRINVKLSSEYPGYDETQSDLMATLGYSSETLDEKAKQAVGYSTDRFLFRPLIRPIERELENRFRLDVVRFSYAIARNFLNSSLNNEELSSSLALLRSSRLMLGKYLTDDIYFLYTGELKAALDYQYLNKSVGLQHIVGLEYRLNPRLLLQVEYDYNTLFETHRGDKKLRLRHSFPF